MDYKLNLISNCGSLRYENSTLLFRSSGESDSTYFSAQLTFSDWENDAFVFLPACAYDGNRFKKTSVKYPPMYEKCDCGINPLPVISDVPALSPDGNGKIEVTAGDLSVPCVGIFYKDKKEAVFIFTEQQIKEKNVGFAIENGKIEIQFPVMRSVCYRMCRTNAPSLDSGIAIESGEQISASLIIKEFSCESIPEFFKLFFENRKCLLSNSPASYAYTHKLWEIMEEHMNRDNFSGEYYAEASKIWQCGWVGGGMSSLPLLQYGSDISKARAVQTVDYLTSYIAPSGFFYSMIKDGEISDDGFGRPHMKSSTLIRKNGDALFFLFKHFEIISPKSAWIQAAKRCSDAFVRLYEKYGDFGQFVDVETGEMLFGGTTSGASSIGALVYAWKYFDDGRYLKYAIDAGEKYYHNFIEKGLCFGGPGEALCACDSESSYAMVESLVLLYEATGDKKWLEYAKDALHLFSSWVMPYSYSFPKDSEFARLKINTVGSVFANVQNKHSAPGICTSSGIAIYKLYKYAKNEKYLELLRDIVRFIPQCVSTDERPIFSWDKEPRAMPSGWICERVNTSDWESPQRVGGVFFGSCWCETSLLLTFSELVKNEEIRALLS